MGCSRCGGNSPRKPAVPPSNGGVNAGRPGTVMNPQRRPSDDNKSVRDTINGLRYVPSSGN